MMFSFQLLPAKIFRAGDVIREDEPLQSLNDLTPGKAVLAKWSENKCYPALVKYVNFEIAKKPDDLKGS